MLAATKGGTRGGGRDEMQRRTNVGLLVILGLFVAFIVGMAVVNAAGIV